VRKLALWLLLALLPTRATMAAEATTVRLTGVAQVAHAARAYGIVLPAGDYATWTIGSEQAGWRLVGLDLKTGAAAFRRGTNQFTARLGSAAVRAVDPYFNPAEFSVGTGGGEPPMIRWHRLGGAGEPPVGGAPGPGHAASADYVGSLRQYAQSLPPEERPAIQAELNRYAAEPLGPGSPTAVPGNPSSNAATGASPQQDGQSQSEATTAAGPEPGSLQGDGREIGALRQQLRAESDPEARRRIQLQLAGYTAPAIAP